MAELKLHSELDGEGTLVGSLHVEKGVLTIDDTPVQDMIAAACGILHGGRATGVLYFCFTKATMTIVTSDQTMGRAFVEPSEPVEGQG